MKNDVIDLKNDLSVCQLRLVDKNFKPKTEMAGINKVMLI